MESSPGDTSCHGPTLAMSDHDDLCTIRFRNKSILGEGDVYAAGDRRTSQFLSVWYTPMSHTLLIKHVEEYT
jgi:hypothetical protein